MDPFKTHGAISWPELQTTDAKAASDFYSAIFGWESESMDMGEAGMYHLGKLGDLPLCGMMKRVSEDMPPCWILYVTVDSADAIAARATELGGQVFVPPTSIPTVGRFCGIADPQGAMIFTMEWEQSDQAMPPVNFADAFTTPGKFSWFQLQTPDVEGGVAFYSELFGWNSEVADMAAGPYTMLKMGDVAFGGAIPPMGEVPAHWGAYVTVADADATAAKIEELGGSTLGPPHDIPGVGRMIVYTDPQGAFLMSIAYETPAE